MPDTLETRLTRAGARLPEPPADATARVRAAALAALPARPRRSPWRRPLRIAAGAAGLAALAALLVALIVATPTGGEAPAPASLRPDAAALGVVAECADPPEDLRIRCIEGTQEVRDRNPALDGAAWLTSGGYTQPARPSLVFPPGTTYPEALDALVENVTLTGGLPPGTALGDPLPGRAALLRPSDPSEGIAISLDAPFGRLPSGRPAGVTFAGDDPDAMSQGYVWPAGTRVAVPDLPACQVVAERAAAPPPCAQGEGPVLRGQRAPDLPVVPLRSAPVDVTLDRVDGGGPLALASLRGRVVVLAAFASWCEPCADQAGAVRAVAARYAADRGVAVVGVVVNDDRAEARRFLRDHRLAMTTLDDRRGDLGAALGVVGLPETLVLDREGRVASRLPGALLDPDQVMREVEALR
jgi:peroxiredoxin